MEMIEIDGRQFPVTRCPTAYAAPTRGGTIPPADRDRLAAYTTKVNEEAPAFGVNFTLGRKRPKSTAA